MAIKVFEPSLNQSKLQHQPQDAFRVHGWEEGLDIAPPKLGRIAFADVIGLSVFSINLGNRHHVHLMLFLRGRPRPIDIDDPGKIHFEDFPGISRDEPVLGKLRQLACRLASAAQLMVVDRETGAFLQGGPARTLEHEPIVMATAFARVLGRYMTPPSGAPADPGPLPAPAAVASPPAGGGYATPQPGASAPPAVPPAATVVGSSRPVSGPGGRHSRYSAGEAAAAGIPISVPVPKATQPGLSPGLKRFIGVLALLGLLYGGHQLVLTVKMSPALRAAIRSQELLVNRLAAPERYVPPSSGVVTPSRIEIFLRIREKTSDQRNELAFLLNQGYPPDPNRIINEKTNAVMRRSIQTAILQPLGEYLKARNENLLEAEMSLGEYLYIYSLVHYSWRGKSPEDGPEISYSRGSRDDRLIFIGDDLFTAVKVRQRYHRLALSFARNQLASMAASDDGYRQLSREIQELEKDPNRVLWGDRLPWDIEAVFDSSGIRLVYSYDTDLNCFEFPVSEEDWREWIL